MSTIKSKKVQIGTDATSSNNFTMYQPATPDGTLRIGVGDAENPTEVGQFNANGYKPAIAPAFLANRSGGSQSVSANTSTKIQFNSEAIDTANCYDPSTNYRFTPTVAGYYYIYARGQVDTTSDLFYSNFYLYKNGGNYSQLFGGNGNGSSFYHGAGGNLVYLNGTTDYVELYCYQTTTHGVTGYFGGYLVQQA